MGGSRGLSGKRRVEKGNGILLVEKISGLSF